MSFSSSSSELDGEDRYNLEADTSRSVRNPSVSSDEGSSENGTTIKNMDCSCVANLNLSCNTDKPCLPLNSLPLK